MVVEQGAQRSSVNQMVVSLVILKHQATGAGGGVIATVADKVQDVDGRWLGQPALQGIHRGGRQTLQDDQAFGLQLTQFRLQPLPLLFDRQPGREVGRVGDHRQDVQRRLDSQGALGLG